MKNVIYSDEISFAPKKFNTYRKYLNTLSKKKHKRKPRNHKKFIVLSDGTSIEEILIPALDGMEDITVTFVNAFPDVAFPEPLKKRTEEMEYVISLEEMKQAAYSDTAFILLIDSKKAHGQWFGILNTCADLAKQGNGNYILVSLLIPDLNPFSSGIKALAEREYDFLLEKSGEAKTPAEKFTIDFERACREIVRNGFDRISLLRFDNLMGSLTSHFGVIDFEKLISDAFAKKEVTVTKEDHLLHFSCMCTFDAAIAVFAAADIAKEGHVYNVTEYFLTVAKIKTAIQNLFPDEISLKTDGLTYSPSETRYYDLSTIKLLNDFTNISKQFQSFKKSLYCVLCNRFDREFDAVSRLTIYGGKLNRLKETEIDILREIDRICRKHNIRYFLAGGSCLGAIRNNKSIPWDDDLDIGMLREDFEVFRRVAPKELDKKYVYSSPQTDENCHYYFDKIRLRDTYFSTRYSGRFVLDDGVFVDIIVYDQTTSNSFFQKLQIRWISYLRTAIYIRWHNYPVPLHPRLSKYLLPFLRLLPFKAYHKLYDRATMRYAKKKNPVYLLDGGAHLKCGGFLKSTLDGDVDYLTFDGMENVPIPSGYPGYLSFMYGEDYRSEPGVFFRLAPHKIARLDLGKYLLENEPKDTFRSVDIRGELFESETES